MNYKLTLNLRLGLIFFIFLLLTFIIFIKSNRNAYSQGSFLAPQGASTSVSATVIGPSAIGYRFSLFGYTSPKALVNLEGRDFHYQTYANTDGYFVFLNKPAGLAPLEACLVAQDQFGRLSKPICLPPLPDNYNYNVEIGPIILPPTLSLNKPVSENAYFIGSDIYLTGQTIPEMEVNLSMFTKERFFFFVKPVEAFSFPRLEAKSDSQGNFSIALPSSSSQIYRLFAQTNYRNYNSPESFILQLEILPIWLMIVKIFFSLLYLLKSRLLEILILGFIIGLLTYIYRLYFHPYMIAKKRVIIVRQHYDLILPEHKIILKENNPLVKR